LGGRNAGYNRIETQNIELYKIIVSDNVTTSGYEDYFIKGMIVDSYNERMSDENREFILTREKAQRKRPDGNG